jgi:hypothetical protein
MGDRVLFQVKGSDGEFSPVAYGHWCGERAPLIVAKLRERMKDRAGDVPYTFARLIQEMCGDSKDGLSFGAWNADKLLTKDDSHGDAGVVLIDVTKNPMTCECVGGYLKTGTDGLPSLP